MKHLITVLGIFFIGTGAWVNSTAVEAHPWTAGGQQTADIFGVPVLAVAEYVFMYSTEAAMNLEIANAGGGTLSWSIGEIVYKKGSGWIDAVEPGSGQTEFSDNATVYVDRQGLAEGIYTAVIPITSNAGNANVTLNMDVLWPAVSPASLTLAPDEEETSFTIVNRSAERVSWQAAVSYSQSAGGKWMSVLPAGGDIPAGDNATAVVSVTREGLSPGEYRAGIALDIVGDSYEADHTVEVKMNVSNRDTDDVCIAEYLFGHGDRRLEMLREFRDSVLLPLPAGRRLMQLYYHNAPLCIAYLETHPQFKKRFKAAVELMLPIAALLSDSG